jgi:hypothetical protein
MTTGLKRKREDAIRAYFGLVFFMTIEKIIKPISKSASMLGAFNKII